MAGEGTVVGRISIKVTPLLRDFWADLKKGIEEAEATLKGEIKFKAKLDTDNLRAQAAAAAKAASQDVKVNVKASKSGFLKDLAEVKAAAKAAGVDLSVDFKDTAAAAKLETLIARLKARAAASKIELNVETKASKSGLAEALLAARAAAAKDFKLKGELDIDFAKTLAEVKAAAKGANVKLDVDFQDTRAEAELAALIAKLKAEAAAANIKLKIDTERKHSERGVFGGIGLPKLPGGGIQDLFNFGTPLNLIALLTLLPPALSLLSASLLSLPALVTAVAAPIGVFALGIKGVKDALSASGLMDVVFGKDKKDGTPGKEKDSPGEVIKKLQEQIADVFRTGLTPVFQNFANALPAITAKLPDIARGIVDIFGGIGNALTSPAAIEGIQKLSTNIGNLLSGMAPGIQSFIESLGKLATGVSNHFPGLANWFNSLADRFSTFVNDLTKVGPDGVSPLDKVVTNLKPSLDGIINLISTLFGNGTKFAQDPGMADKIKGVFDTISHFATDTLPALAAGFKSLADLLSLIPHVQTPEEKQAQQQKDQGNSTKGTGEANLPGWFDPEGWGIDIKNFFTTTLPGILQAAGTLLKPYWDQLFQGAKDAVTQLGTDISNFFTQTLPGFFTGIGQQLSTAWDGLWQSASQAKDKVVQFFSDLPGQISQFFSQAVDQSIAFLSTLPGKAVAALAGLAEAGYNAGVQLVQGLINGIGSLIGGAIAKAKELASSVASAVTGFLGIHSPSKLFHGYGVNTAQGYQDGLTEGFQGVIDQAKALAAEVAQAMSDGTGVSPQLQANIKRELSAIKLQYDQLKQQKNALDPKDKEGRKAIQGQMDQLNAARDQLGYQKDQLGYAKQYGAQTDSTNQAAQMITQALAKMLDAAKSLVMGPANQLMGDLGISGQGAIPSIANAGIDWGMQAVNGMVQGAFGQGKGQQGGGTTIQVTNDESALAMKRTLDAREMQQYVSR